MYFLKCINCGHFNDGKIENLVFCSKCNKKLINNYSDWQKVNLEKNIDDFKNTICSTQDDVQKSKISLLVSKRKPLISVISSMIIPGLGQLYNGQINKAFSIFALCLIIPVIAGLIRLTTTFHGFILYFSIGLFFYLLILIDAYRNSKIQKDYQLKKFNHWRVYTFYVFFVLLILVVCDVNDVLGTKSYKVSFNSSQPTMKSGDHVVVDLNAYKLKPIDYGDLVVMLDKNKDRRIYRVIGKPNDTISIKDSCVRINSFDCKLRFISNSSIDDYAVHEYEEELPNGHKHQICTNILKPVSLQTQIDKVIVPVNSYYVLGDNRDNALDSRYVGFIQSNQIFGQAIYIPFGKTLDRLNINLKEN